MTAARRDMVALFTQLRKLKSSLSRFQGARLNFAHLNPGSAVPFVGELNKLFNGRDLQMIAASDTWYNTKHTNRQVNLKGYRVIRADRDGGRRGGEREFKIQGSCAVYTIICTGLTFH
jgi:hypothetical protein